MGFRENIPKIILGTGAVIVLFLCVFHFVCLPDKIFDSTYSPTLYDGENRLVSARVAADGQWRFHSIDSVPDKYKACVLRFEDQHFYTHSGVRWVSVARAMLQNLKEGRVVSGGSTISMQTVRLSRNNPSRSYLEKGAEMLRAIRLETLYNKEEILLMYANHAPMGGNIVGLEAASWKYFDHSPSQLSWAEAATLAVLPNAPGKMHLSKNRALLVEKRNRLLVKLAIDEKIDSLSLNLALTEPLPAKVYSTERLADQLLNKAGKLGDNGQMKTTLNSDLQRQSQILLNRHVDHAKANEINHAAAIVVDVESGNVLAYIPNVNHTKGHGNSMDLIRAPRSTGSILKPFLYADMLDKGKLLPKILLADIPTYINGYRPENYDKKFRGAIPANEALSLSLNVPAVRSLQTHGVQRTHKMLLDIGFGHLNRPAYQYGLSLILGGGEATLWEVANAYTGMVRSVKFFGTRDGASPSSDYSAMHIFQGDQNDTDSDEAPFTAGAAYLALEAMLEVNRPSGESGWEKFNSSHGIAWKTGTSYGNRDAWSAGTNGKYVVAVWVGNADGVGRPGLTGTGYAAPLMFEIFRTINNSGYWDIPYDDLKEVQVCAESGHLAGSHCEHITTQLTTNRETNLTACPYHTKIWTTNNGAHRVQRNCDADGMVEKSAFILPPIQAWYYKQFHPQYRSLPPMHPSCTSESINHGLSIIYPHNGALIKLPIDLDGQINIMVAKASTSKSLTTLYWHLDDEYIGSTSELHQLSMTPAKGPHALTLITEDGNESKVTFSVQ